MSSILGGIAGNLAGGNIGRATVALALDTTGYNSQLEKAKGDTAAASTGMAKGFDILKGAAVLGAAAAGVALVKFAGTAVQAASDETEAANKVNEVFLNSADSVTAFAEKSAEGFGISKTAALEAAGSFGNLLHSAGIVESSAADMSVSLVKLAADLASFNNVDPTEALQKLQSGLAGQARPLRAFGILLSETAVQEEAYRAGIAKTGAELTDAQKVQARYNLIFKDSQKAQGDFARTSGGLANSSRILHAELEDLTAELGKHLEPALISATHAATGFIEQIGPVLGDVSDAVFGADTSIVAFTGDTLKAGIATGVASSAFTTGKAGIAAWNEEFDKLAIAYDAGRISGDEFATSLNSLTNGLTDGINSTLDANTATGEYAERIKQAVDANDAYIAKLREQQNASDDATRAIEHHTAAMQEERLALLQAAGGQLGLVSALQQVQEDERALQTLRNQGKQGTAAYSEAVVKATTDTLDFRTQLREQIASLTESGKSMHDIRNVLREMATQAGVTGQEFRSAFGSALDEIKRKADATGQSIQHIGDPVTVHVNSQAIGYAEAHAQNLLDRLQRLGV